MCNSHILPTVDKDTLTPTSSPAFLVIWVPGQSGLWREILSQTEQNKDDTELIYLQAMCQASCFHELSLRLGELWRWNCPWVVSSHPYSSKLLGSSFWTSVASLLWSTIGALSKVSRHNLHYLGQVSLNCPEHRREDWVVLLRDYSAWSLEAYNVCPISHVLFEFPEQLTGEEGLTPAPRLPIHMFVSKCPPSTLVWDNPQLCVREESTSKDPKS